MTATYGSMAEYHHRQGKNNHGDNYDIERHDKEEGLLDHH